MDPNGNQVMKKGKPLLEFVAITRKDTGEVAIPGVIKRSKVLLTVFKIRIENQNVYENKAVIDEIRIKLI